MKISFSRLKSNEILEQPEVSWDDIRDIFKVHTITEHKEDALLFSPCEFMPGKPRGNANAVRIHFGVLDLDGVTKQDIDYIKEKLTNHTYIFYSTWSHQPDTDTHRCRLLLPFSRPVERGEWSRFWASFHKFFNELNDPACKDMARIYFMPSCKDTEGHFIEQNEGIVFDVNFLYQTPKEKLAPISLNSIDLKEMANKLKRKKSEHAITMGEAILLGISGKPVALPGDRDATLFKIANALVEEFPNHDPKTLSEPFAESIKQMQKDSAGKTNTYDWLEAKIARVHTKKEEDRKAASVAVDEDVAFKIQLSFGEKSHRRHPYTSEELEQFADEADTTVAFFTKRWILQYKNIYYVFHNHRYKGPFSKEELFSVCDTYLAPAISAEVSCWTEDAKGKRHKKTPAALAEEYGTVIFHISMDLNAQKDRYIGDTRTLIEAPCPRRDIAPKYNPEIATWLQLLGGDDHETLLDWLSQVPNLDKPCAALYIGEAGGIGKSLLAKGIARIWTTGSATELDSIVKDFNAEIVRCPFIFADETLPTGQSKGSMADLIKKIVQSSSYTLKRKFMPETQVHGAVRLMLAANNRDMLAMSENQTKDDLNAFIERFIYIPGKPEVKEYLESLGGRGYLDSWQSEDHIAAHVMWLNENRQLAHPTRFLVSGKNSSFIRGLTANSGFASTLNHWLISYIQDPTKVNILKASQIIIKDGDLYVTPKGLVSHWNLYDTGHPLPTPGRVSKTLDKICLGKKKSIRTNVGTRYYWKVDFENLCYWAETNGYETRESLKQKLTKETEMIGEWTNDEA